MYIEKRIFFLEIYFFAFVFFFFVCGSLLATGCDDTFFFSQTVFIVKKYPTHSNTTQWRYTEKRIEYILHIYDVRSFYAYIHNQIVYL